MSDNPYLIRCICIADGTRSLFEGMFLKHFDPDGCGGRGVDAWTDDPGQAIHHAEAKDAFTTWTKQSTVRPLREDGEPNRPLTGYTVEVVRLNDARMSAPAQGQA